MFVSFYRYVYVFIDIHVHVCIHKYIFSLWHISILLKIMPLYMHNASTTPTYTHKKHATRWNTNSESMSDSQRERASAIHTKPSYKHWKKRIFEASSWCSNSVTTNIDANISRTCLQAWCAEIARCLLLSRTTLCHYIVLQETKPG